MFYIQIDVRKREKKVGTFHMDLVMEVLCPTH
uniref:Uncharacterized protein n=1 Tax=Rhizophora mucronata TaxID=61149 RepID=A0A2P2NTJ6_RHIMU